MYNIIFHRAKIELTRHTSDVYIYMGGSILTTTDNLNTLELLYGIT